MSKRSSRVQSEVGNGDEGGKHWPDSESWSCAQAVAGAGVHKLQPVYGHIVFAVRIGLFMAIFKCSIYIGIAGLQLFAVNLC